MSENRTPIRERLRTRKSQELPVLPESPETPPVRQTNKKRKRSCKNSKISENPESPENQASKKVFKSPIIRSPEIPDEILVKMSETHDQSDSDLIV